MDSAIEEVVNIVVDIVMEPGEYRTSFVRN